MKRYVSESSIFLIWLSNTPPTPQISASLPEIQFWWLGRHRPAFARMNSNHFHPPFWLWWIITSWGNDFLVFVPETGSHRVAQAARHLFYAHNDTDFAVLPPRPQVLVLVTCRHTWVCSYDPVRILLLTTHHCQNPQRSKNPQELTGSQISREESFYGC